MKHHEFPRPVRFLTWPIACFLICGLSISFRTSFGAVTAPGGFVVENAFPTATFDKPVQIAFLPDGRKLVIELEGRVWTILPNGTKWSTPFIDLRDEIRSHHDLGMTCVAVDPDFATNKWIYLGYVVDPGNPPADDDQFCRLTRYRMDSSPPHVADLATREVLIGETWTEGFPTLTFSHTIGTIRFAPDKSLLVSAGDGGQFMSVDSGGQDPNAFGPGRTDPSEDIGAFRARSVDSKAGKILRIDKETGLGLSSNPYWDGDPDSDRSRVYAYGLRNPYRFSIRPGTGSTDPFAGDPGVLYVGDVGWNTFEEFVIVTEAGMNFGWPCFEGAAANGFYQAVSKTEAGNDSILCWTGQLNLENPVAPTPPRYWWHHVSGSQSFPVGWTGSSVTGGVFYTGDDYPVEYQGRYFIADYVRSWIRTIDVDGADNVVGWGDFITAAEGPVDIESDPETGDLYYIAIFANQVRRIRYEGGVGVGEDVGQVAPLLTTASHPNPFRETAAIEFTMTSPEVVSVQVFSAEGVLVRTLLEGDTVSEGTHTLTWDGLDDLGNRVSRGVYFYQVQAGDYAQGRKIVLQ